MIESRVIESTPDRRYAMRQVRQRLHQSMFRQAVLAAYGGRCAVSGLPEASLLDAAHIVEDGNEKLGQPVVQNDLHDGLMLETLKRVDGARIRLPRRPEDCPDRERLEERFDQFKATA